MNRSALDQSILLGASLLAAISVLNLICGHWATAITGLIVALISVDVVCGSDDDKNSYQ